MLWRELARTRNLWREFNRLQHEMDRMFKGVQTNGRVDYPPVNAWTSEDGVVVTAELPGVNPEDVDISVVGETLTIRGSRKPEELGEKDVYHRRERVHEQFSRTLQLPYQVEVDKVEASFKNGILKIVLPRAEVDKPRKITVKAE